MRKPDPALFVKKLYTAFLINRKAPRATALRNDGIGIVSELKYICSLSQLARDFTDAIVHTDIPSAILDTSIPLVSRKTISSDEVSHFAALECSSFDQRHVINFSTIPCHKNKRYCNAITPFWEFKSGMPECRPGIFDGTDVVIAYSGFLQEYFESIVPAGTRVLRFRYPYFPQTAARPQKKESRAKLSLPKDAFIVLFNFDFSSSYARKNPEAALAAFAHAFPSRDDDALLVFKTSHAQNHPKERAALSQKATALGIEGRVVFFDNYMSRGDVLALTAAADAYLSLHRGEGLGMGMLEAMTLGLPVVATAFGGNTDFVTEETAFPVPYKLMPAKPDIPEYAHVTEWAEPDIDAAAGFLLKIRNDPALAAAKTSKSAEFISRHFTREGFLSDIRAFLEI